MEPGIFALPVTRKKMMSPFFSLEKRLNVIKILRSTQNTCTIIPLLLFFDISKSINEIYITDHFLFWEISKNKSIIVQVFWVLCTSLNFYHIWLLFQGEKWWQEVAPLAFVTKYTRPSRFSGKQTLNFWFTQNVELFSGKTVGWKWLKMYTNIQSNKMKVGL